MVDKIVKTDEEWRRILTDEQYRITRAKGTEPAFTGAYWSTKSLGTYVCSNCGLPLFASAHKYDSGSGWPSFSEALGSDHVQTQTDRTLGMVRTEVQCARCAAHLGHVFDDGPQPTGQRFCINSAALKLEEDKHGKS